MATATLAATLFAINAATYVFLFILVLLSRHRSETRTSLLIACGMTAASAIAVAGGWGGPLGSAGALAELTASGGWCVFILRLIQRRLPSDRWLFPLLYGCAILIGCLILGFPLLQPQWSVISDPDLSNLGELASRLSLAVFGVLLTENLYRNTASESRWHINLLCIGLGGFFCYSLIVYADALLFRRISPLLWEGRAIVMTVAAPLIAVTVARNRDWAVDIHVSRSVVFHTATLVGSGIFLLALAATGGIIRAINPNWGEVIEVTLIVAGIAVVAVILTSGSARSQLQRIVLDNFFSHRYDYRREWLKSIQRLSVADATVQSRAISAVAEIADSPGAFLWVRDLEGTAFQWAGSWNRPAVAAVESIHSPFLDLFRGAEWIIEAAKIEDPPHWLAEIDDAWLIVPLAHRDQLIGFIVLTKPRAALKLDGEIFDLLRIVGRQAATHIIEQKYAQALAANRDLHDYSKRFAFVIHDMKNVVGQLAMIIQNSRYHRDNPEFHDDVLITVQSAVDRMNGLLERLRSRQLPAAERVAPVDIIRNEVMALQRIHGVDINVADDGKAAEIAMDEIAFRSVIRHLCENAIDASPDQVQLRLSLEATQFKIEIIDRGAGMTPEFIRDRLFQPFGSTKGNGLGIGAYQARELVRAVGGDLFAASKPGTGTVISIVLPCSEEEFRISA